jgi:hypothetical protein
VSDDHADKLIARHLAIKDHLAVQAKEFAAFCKPFKDEMDQIEAKLREMILALGEGAESIKTNNGTAYTSLITTPGIEDREKYLDYCLENWDSVGNEMLQLGKPQITAIKTYMDEHEGALPPGVKISTYQQLNIRRS